MSLTDNEKKVIAVELGKLTLLRQEKVSDYNFELWIEYFEDAGMTFPEIVQAIKGSRELKKYGGTLLSVGDVVDNYREAEATERQVSWTTFLRELSKYEKKAQGDIRLLYGQHIPIETYLRNKQLLETQLENAYLKPSEEQIVMAERASWLRWLKTQMMNKDALKAINEKIIELESEGLVG